MQQPLNTHPINSAYRSFDLVKARYNASRLSPATHQSEALGALNTWFENDGLAERGGIVVLPTGGGKTFTAVRFLCREPLSQDYKVLWLAHTHHLLDQANSAFAPLDPKRQQERGLEAGLIAEPKPTLNVRVVSGTRGHCPPNAIKGGDDVVIATLQTMTRAMQNLSSLPGLKAWLKSAQNLIVVFDEAHHAPASSYRKLLETLRQSHPELLLLGLTATPIHSDQSKNNWQDKLFPQGILHEVSAEKLMLSGVLATPDFEKYTTQFVPKWNEREFQKWLGTYGDLPESVVSALAKNSERNALIANTYASNREKYGKTIIFAERWYQCEQIRDYLQARGIKAGVLHSHVGAGTVTNQGDLDAFRGDELDVLINVRMLTEGTDVPGVQSVFLTRQTTSQILLTQMVGRALRGPKFGGTAKAYIVSFHDNWQHMIPWAKPVLPTGKAQMEDDAVLSGETNQGSPSLGDLSPIEDSLSSAHSRPPLQDISLEIARHLAQATDYGQNVATGEFTSLVPVGWYVTSFDTLVLPSTEDDEQDDDVEGDDIETVRDIVLVYDRDLAAYEGLVAHLQTQPLDEFASTEVTLEAVRSTVEEWQRQFFASDAKRTRQERLRHLLNIARHMAQRMGSGAAVVPPYLAFEQRQSLDLDAIAWDYIQNGLGPRAIRTALLEEFDRNDRFWKVIYSTFEDFRSHYDACENRLVAVELPVPEIKTTFPPEKAHEPEVGEPELGEPELGDEL